MNHPCQALADWRTLDELESAAAGRDSCCAGPIIRGRCRSRFRLAVVHMAAMRGMKVVVAPSGGFALRAR